MWVLGGGGSLSSVVQMAEANFDHDSADVLLNDHLARGRRLSSYHRYLEVARATWDLISDETAASVLTELRPSSSPDPDQELVRSVFAVLATRAPEVWAAQFNKLDPGTQVVLLDSLTTGAASFLSDQLIEALLQLAKGRLLTGNASENLYVLCAFLLRRSLSKSKERDNDALVALRAARPEVIARLGRMDLDLIGEEAVERAAQELGRQVLTENDEARTKGTTAIRSFNSRVRLGLALDSLPSPPQDLTRALIETATDSSLPADYRLDALRGLMVVAQAGVLDPALAKQLSRLQPPAEPSWFSNVSGRLLEVAVRAVTALAAPREDDEVVCWARVGTRISGFEILLLRQQLI